MKDRRHACKKLIYSRRSVHNMFNINLSVYFTDKQEHKNYTVTFNHSQTKDLSSGNTKLERFPPQEGIETWTVRSAFNPLS